MPYKTVWDVFDGWMEPRQVWVEPTPEEIEAQEAYAREGEDLAKRTAALTADIVVFLERGGILDAAAGSEVK